MFKLKGDTNKLVRGVSFSWLRFALTIGIGLLQTPILFKNLKNDELNFWYIFYSFGAFLQMADLGLVQTISRLIAYLDNTIDNSHEETIGLLSKFKIKQIYITSLFSFTCILILIGIIIFVSFLVLHVGEENVDELKISFLLYLMSIIFSLLSNIPGAMLIGYRDIGPESIVRSIFQILYFAILFFGLPYYKSIVFVSIAFLVQSLGQFLLLHISFYKRHTKIFKEYVPAKDFIKLDISRGIYKQSMPLVINQLGGWLISQGNIFVASVVIGADKISDYAINQQVFTYIATIALVINQTMGPFIAKQYIQNKHELLKELFNGTVIISLSIVSILLIIQMICGYEIIHLWVGGKHYLGITFSFLFGLITFLEVHHSVGGNFVWNTRSWPFNSWTLVAGLLNVSLGYIFGSYFGLVGIAFATLISKLITLNWYVIYYCLKKLNILIIRYLTNTFIPITLILLVVYGANTVLSTILKANDVNSIVSILIISCISSISVALLTGLVFRTLFVNLYKFLVLKNGGKTVEGVV